MKNYLTNTCLRKFLWRFALAGIGLFLCGGSLFAAGVNLTWNASPSANVAGYKVSYGSTSGNYPSTIDAGKTTSVAVTGLQEGSKYYFAAKAYNSAKTVESAYSNEINVTLPVTAVLSADFTASKTSGDAPLAVSFTPVTTGSITSWKWDLAGSYTPSVTNSTAQTVTVTYPNPGTYSVALTVTGPSGSITQTKSNLITVTTPPAPPPPPPAPPPVSETSKVGLVAAYGFEEISGATVADASGKGNHGAITGATRITAGRYGNALKFDGVSNWVTVNNSTSLALSSGLTLEAWVFPQSLTTGGKTVIMKEQAGGAVYNLYANEDSNVPISSFYDGNYRVVSGTSQLPANKWSHLVATYDGQYQRLYVNGLEIAKRVQATLIQQSSGVLRIGGNNVWGEYFQGYIDEVRIYNRALTDAEVNYNLTTAISVSNPPQFVMGDNNLEPWVDYRAQGTAEAFQTTPQKSGVITTVQVYLDASSTATKLVAGIYKNNAGHPGALISQGSLSTLKAGAWNSVPIPVTSVTAAQPFWIAILGASGQIGFLDLVGTGTGLMETSSSKVLTTLPSTWAGTAYKANASMSTYGNGY